MFKKKINETFGSKMANANNLWTIFGITTLVASIAAVTGLSGVQTASADVIPGTEEADFIVGTPEADLIDSKGG
ncbi:MAG TPA: hypothetical protein VFY68_10740, partial [Nitrososphaeraceae archaeon]|nr:hypothetical protein [Nitrososphaeraceae archaeon]